MIVPHQSHDLACYLRCLSIGPETSWDPGTSTQEDINDRKCFQSMVMEDTLAAPEGGQHWTEWWLLRCSWMLLKCVISHQCLLPAEWQLVMLSLAFIKQITAWWNRNKFSYLSRAQTYCRTLWQSHFVVHLLKTCINWLSLSVRNVNYEHIC